MGINFDIDDEEFKLPSPIILAGSEILSGEARMVVLCVGKFSKIGSFVYEIKRNNLYKKSEM